MNALRQPIAENPFVFEVTQEDFEQTNPELCIPDLELGEDPMAFRGTVIDFFRRTWEINGYPTKRSPRHTIITSQPTDTEPGLVLVSSYRGKTDRQISSRKKPLKNYLAKLAELTPIEGDEREEQKKELSLILGKLPDLNGLQGVEEYQLLLVPELDSLPLRYRLNSGKLLVSQSHYLGQEAEDYCLPTRQAGVPWSVYPYISPQPPQLWLDREPFPRRDISETNAEEWRQRLGRLVPLLRQQTLALVG